MICVHFAMLAFGIFLIAGVFKELDRRANEGTPRYRSSGEDKQGLGCLIGFVLIFVSIAGIVSGMILGVDIVSNPDALRAYIKGAK